MASSCLPVPSSLGSITFTSVRLLDYHKVYTIHTLCLHASIFMTDVCAHFHAGTFALHTDTHTHTCGSGVNKWG